MRRTLIHGLALSALLASCATAAPATTAPGAPGAGTSVTEPTAVAPSIPALPSGLPSFPSIAIPSLPSFTSDQDLASRFPTTVAGSPLMVQTLRAAEFLQFFEGDPESEAQAQAFLQAVGVPIEAVSIGIASFEYEDSSEQLTAIRAAGADPSRLLTSLVEFTRNDADDPSSVQVSQSTVGGKPVSVLTAPDETTTYVYGDGDIVWAFETEDPTLADQVMGAIP